MNLSEVKNNSKKPPSFRPKVLIVGNLAGRRKKTCDELSRNGIDYFMADGWLEAVQLIKNGEYSSVITDGFDGKWAFVASAAKYCNANIILVTEDLISLKAAKVLSIKCAANGILLSGFLKQELAHLNQLPSETMLARNLAEL